MKYAIVESGNRQYRAEEGGYIEVEKLALEPGSNVDLEVLLMADGEAVRVGQPRVDGAVAKATVVEHFKGPKIRVFHYKPKKRYRKTQGHRQTYTRLKIETLVG